MMVIHSKNVTISFVDKFPACTIGVHLIYEVSACKQQIGGTVGNNIGLVLCKSHTHHAYILAIWTVHGLLMILQAT